MKYDDYLSDSLSIKLYRMLILLIALGTIIAGNTWYHAGTSFYYVLGGICIFALTLIIGLMSINDTVSNELKGD